MNRQRAASWCTWSDLNDWNYQKPKFQKQERPESWNSLKAGTAWKLEQPESWNNLKAGTPESWTDLKAGTTWKLERPESWERTEQHLPRIQLSSAYTRTDTDTD